MDSVKVNRQTLLGKARENLAKHLKEYKVACDEWRIVTKEKAVELHTKVLKILTELNEKSTADLIKDFEHKVLELNFAKPLCYAKDYEEAIKMLEMSVEDEVVITQNVFKQLVLDEWSWKKAELNKRIFYTSNSALLNANFNE